MYALQNTHMEKEELIMAESLSLEINSLYLTKAFKDLFQIKKKNLEITSNIERNLLVMTKSERVI